MKYRIAPNDFRGWCKKREEVGAHRLICVSAEPYPQSIIDEVTKRLGPTVLLVRLRDLERDHWPIQILNHSMKVFRSKIDVDLSVQPFFFFPPGNNTFKEPQIIRKLNRRLYRLPEGKHRVDHKWNPKGATLCLGELSAPIQEFSVSYQIQVDSFVFPFEISSYAQEGHEPQLAWVARACGVIDGEEAEIRISFVPQSTGLFSFGGVETVGIKEGCFLFWGYAKDDPQAGN